MVEWKELGDVCNVHTGGQLNRNNMIENGAYPVINGGKFPSGYTNSFNEHANNITISQGGESAGYVNWIDTNFWAGAHCYVVCHNENIEKRYLYYALKNIEVILQSVKQGAGIPGLNRKTLYKQIIPIPSKSEQERIVSILDTFTSSIANLKEQIKERRKQYEHYRDQLLDLEGKEGVEMKMLGKMASFKYGYTSKANEIGSHRYIRITDIDKYGRLYFEDEKYINASNEAEDYILKKDDIVVARTGATYGKTLIFEYDFPAIYASFLIKVDLQDFLLPKYYWHFAQSSFYWKQANKLVGGGAQPQFNVGAISQICIPIPSKQEQSRIVTILDQFEASIANLEAQLKEREKQYEYYRNQLLTFE